MERCRPERGRSCENDFADIVLGSLTVTAAAETTVDVTGQADGANRPVFYCRQWKASNGNPDVVTVVKMPIQGNVRFVKEGARPLAYGGVATTDGDLKVSEGRLSLTADARFAHVGNVVVGKGSVWNWGRDPYRPYLPELIEKINACAKRVQPALRALRRGKVAMLYPYLYARGLPFAPFVARDAVRLDWFNALAFSGCEPDVLSEETCWTRLDPSVYPVLFAPQCDIVRDRTWAAVKDYLRKGGRLVMTDGSFAKTFGRFAATDVAEQPNVTRVPETRTMEALQETFRPMLPPDDLSLSVGDGGGENPLIHRVFVRQGDFAFLYLHNWGGQDHAVSLRLPQTVEGWTLVPMEGAFR